jgi:DNA-directed RNA polymerase II subunit RPB1
MTEVSKELSKELAEVSKEVAEVSKETSKEVAEMSKEVAKTSKEVAETSRKVAEVSKNVGGLNRSMGELIETLIAARLWEKFSDCPYNLKRAYQRIPLYDERNFKKTDIDILLSDTEWAMAVEVKRELDKKDEVDAHVKRMELIRKYPPAETVGKKLLGAMAGGVVDPDVSDYAYKSGFFVLELTGESVSLLQPPDGFEPYEW